MISTGWVGKSAGFAIGLTAVTGEEATTGDAVSRAAGTGGVTTIGLLSVGVTGGLLPIEHAAETSSGEAPSRRPIAVRRDTRRPASRGNGGASSSMVTMKQMREPTD